MKSEQDQKSGIKPKGEAKAAPKPPKGRNFKECRECLIEFQNEEQKYRKEVDELVGTLQRLQADFENYRKRCDRDSAEFRKYAEARLIADMLPVIDALDMALKCSGREDEFTKGMSMISRQIHDLLAKRGLKAIDCCGKRFDPYYHEVMLSSDSGGEEGVVLEELQKGYMLHDKIIRHSKVKVSRKKSDGDKFSKKG